MKCWAVGSTSITWTLDWLETVDSFTCGWRANFWMAEVAMWWLTAIKPIITKQKARNNELNNLLDFIMQCFNLFDMIKYTATIKMIVPRNR